MRLTQDQRHAIVTEAASIIDCPAEREAEEKAHAELAADLREWLNAILSVEDANVLALHGCLSRSSTLQCNAPDNKQSVGFCFCPRDYRHPLRRGCHRQGGGATTAEAAEREALSVSIPISWRGPYGNDASIPVANRQDWWARFVAFSEAQLTHDKARNAILDKLRRGLEGCKTMAAAIALWPHSAALLPRAAVPPTESESERIAAELATVAVRSS